MLRIGSILVYSFQRIKNTHIYNAVLPDAFEENMPNQQGNYARFPKILPI